MDYSLEELLKSKDYRVRQKANTLLNDNISVTARFKIVLEQVII